MNPFAPRTYGSLERVTDRVYIFRNIVNSAVIIGEGHTLAAGSLEELRGEADAGVTLVVDGSDDQIDTLVADLERRGARVDHNGRRLTIEAHASAGASGSVFDLTRDACVAAGVGIVRLGRRRLSLEDVFLEKLG